MSDRKATSKGPEEMSEKANKPRQRKLGQVIALIIGIIICLILIAPSIAGYLSVSVVSASGQFDGQPCTVSLYEGDQIAVLVDDDPSNDPAPVKQNGSTVGQSTTFNGMQFGTYTIDVSLQDDSADQNIESKPFTVTMWGIDSRQTYEIS